MDPYSSKNKDLELLANTTVHSRVLGGTRLDPKFRK